MSKKYKGFKGSGMNSKPSQRQIKIATAKLIRQYFTHKLSGGKANEQRKQI